MKERAKSNNASDANHNNKNEQNDIKFYLCSAIKNKEKFKNQDILH